MLPIRSTHAQETEENSLSLLVLPPCQGGLVLLDSYDIVLKETRKRERMHSSAAYPGSLFH